MKHENKSLVILTPGFPQSEADTTCLPMQQYFVKTLKEMYPQLSIIILSFQYPYQVGTYKCFDITVMSFNGQNKPGLTRFFLRRKLNSTLKKIKQKTTIAGIVSLWYGECAWVGKKFADKNTLKHFCWIMGQDAKKENKYPNQIHATATELIALSDFLQDEFEKNHTVRPAFVIPPGVDNRQFNTEIKEKNIDLLAAGSLIPLKQFEIFVELVAEIKKHIPNVKAMLIGDGTEKSRLQRLIEKYELQSNITLTGELSHPEVLQWMQKTKIFLHPSAYEGFSGVCQEALAAGAHVISFCKPMKQDIEQWHIVNHTNEMKEKILNLLQSSAVTYKSIIPFSMDETVKKMMELFAV